jgi:cold shock CspA family protein|tara:strand:+ start:3526 stop:3753 length:228 start_codon:yes stop_codon:yes gene_type:complete
MSDRIHGILKWFDAKKGYGFITPESGGQDVFVHVSAFNAASITNIQNKMMLEFEMVDNRGRMIAGNLAIPDSFNR